MNTKNMVIVLLIGVVAAVSVWPFSFEPISRSFTPSGRGSTQSFRVKNDGSEYIALRIIMFSREIDSFGKETIKPADSLFTVYPRQIVLEPESVQTVRVKWEGPGDIASEQAYRILVEQVPVDFSGGDTRDSGIRIVFRYLGSIYITPPGADPDLVAENIRVIRAEEETPFVEFDFHNRGVRHTILSELNITVSSEDSPQQELVFTPEMLDGINGENILAGGTRHVRLAVPEELSSGNVRIDFTYDQNN